MRKIILTEEQLQALRDAVKQPRPMPDFIMSDVENKRTPLGDCRYVYGNFLAKGLEKRYDEILGYFNDDISQRSNDEVYTKLAKLINKCEKKEEPIKSNLESACYNRIMELFGIPDGAVNLECSLSEIPQGARLHIKPDTDEAEYDSISDIESSDLEVLKRKIANLITYGCAYRLSEKVMNEMLGDIFAEDEELPHLYSRIMKINDYLVFVSNVRIEDEDHKQGGTVEVNLAREGEIPTIKATGILLPILVLETISGLLELITTNGLPDDQERARRILNVSDALENEPWIMRLGQAFWDPISETTNVQPEEVPYLIAELVTMSDSDPEAFLSMINEFTAGTRAGREQMRSIYNKAKYNMEYGRFETDMAVKRKENMITDSYFTEEELMGDMVDGTED